MSMEEPSIVDNLVCDFINDRLNRDGFEWATCPALPPPNTVNLTMRVLAQEFELRYKDLFIQMARQLHITPSSAYPTFMGVVDDLFSADIQWGRIVALFAFAGSIASQAMNKEMPDLVDSIVEWVTTYVNNHLMEWINQNGSWDGLVEFYDVDVVPDIRDETWPTLRNFLCGVAAGAIGVLTVGAILTWWS